MEKIFSKKEPWLLLHIIHRLTDIDSERNDIAPAEQFLQLSSLKLQAGKTFKPHKHIIKDGPSRTLAQESWVVIKGKVKCIFYDIDDTVIAEPVLNAGDCSMTFNGGHNYEILEDDSIIYEYKTGPYLGQEKDKQFI